MGAAASSYPRTLLAAGVSAAELFLVRRRGGCVFDLFYFLFD